jgi:DNA primase small subunit
VDKLFAAHRARRMTDEQRSALAAYFALYKGQEEGLAKMFLSSTDHPFVGSSYALLDAAWQQVRL